MISVVGSLTDLLTWSFLISLVRLTDPELHEWKKLMSSEIVQHFYDFEMNSVRSVMRRAGDRRHSYTDALPDNITKLALDILGSSLLLRWIQDLFPKAVHVKQSWSALLRELSSSEKAKTFARIVSLQHKNTARWKLHVIFFAC